MTLGTALLLIFAAYLADMSSPCVRFSFALVHLTFALSSP
jgi:hypothetical protein